MQEKGERILGVNLPLATKSSSTSNLTLTISAALWRRRPVSVHPARAVATFCCKNCSMRSKVCSTFPVMTIKKSTEKLTASKSVDAVPSAIALQLDQLVGAIVGSTTVGIPVGDGATVVGSMGAAEDGATTVGSLGAAGACDRVGSSEQYLGYFVGSCVNVGRGDTVGATGDLVLAFPLLVGLAVIDGAGEWVGFLVFLTFVGAGEVVGVGSSTQGFSALLDPLPLP
jgi:hypothetical protein